LRADFFTRRRVADFDIPNLPLPDVNSTAEVRSGGHALRQAAMILR